MSYTSRLRPPTALMLRRAIFVHHVKEPCATVAAMRDASGSCDALIDPSRRAFGPPQDEGMARRKAQTRAALSGQGGYA